jgi:hypothetical protein
MMDYESQQRDRDRDLQVETDRLYLAYLGGKEYLLAPRPRIG